jgi:hypothetical protein
MEEKGGQAMRKQVEVEGTLREDGTLVLDHKPELPPGRVRVMLQFVGELPAIKETLWQFMQRARAELEASGHRFRSQEDIDAEIEDIRSGDERLEEVYRQAEEQRREQKGC